MATTNSRRWYFVRKDDADSTQLEAAVNRRLGSLPNTVRMTDVYLHYGVGNLLPSGWAETLTGSSASPELYNSVIRAIVNEIAANPERCVDDFMRARAELLESSASLKATKPERSVKPKESSPPQGKADESDEAASKGTKPTGFNEDIGKL